MSQSDGVLVTRPILLGDGPPNFPGKFPIFTDQTLASSALSDYLNHRPTYSRGDASPMRATRFTLCAAFAVVLFSTTSQAAPLAPGALLFPMPGEPDPVGGTVLATSAAPFVAGTYSGTLTSTVISGDTSNALGGLTFTYLLTNDPAPLSTHSINRMTINGWEAFSLDVSFQTPLPAGAVAPAFADREVSGSAIGFSFVSAPIGAGALAPGQTSALMVVQTNAPAFVPSVASVLDGLPAVVGTFAPVPEPSTFVLAAAGLLLVGYRLARRTRRS